MKVNTYNLEEYIYMDLSLTMSKEKLSAALYAGIETNAKFPILYNMNRLKYTRSQNSRNNAHIKVHIHKDMIAKFEELSQLKLETPQKVSLNSSQ